MVVVFPGSWCHCRVFRNEAALLGYWILIWSCLGVMAGQIFFFFFLLFFCLFFQFSGWKDDFFGDLPGQE